MTREDLGRITLELGLRLEDEELEILFHRLKSMKRAIRDLDELVELSLEPLPTVTLRSDE